MVQVRAESMLAGRLRWNNDSSPWRSVEGCLLGSTLKCARVSGFSKGIVLATIVAGIHYLPRSHFVEASSQPEHRTVTRHLGSVASLDSEVSLL